MNIATRLLVSTALALSVSACATKNKPPIISYDTEDFEPALVEQAPLLPFEVVSIPEPLPLPGQLKLIDIRDDIKIDLSDSLEPTDRVENANKAARLEPVKDGYINAIQVYPFSKGALYQLYAAPEQVTDIALQEGEKLLSVSAGDTVRWVLGDTMSGSGVESQVHILVKPTAADLKTNLIITTDKRAYHLEMQSFETTYMASISWHYPHGELTSLRRVAAKAEQADNKVVDYGIDLNRIKFRYEITGDNAPWKPTQVFDDGRKVYIEFPSGIIQGEAPPLFVVGSEGENQLVNYRMKGRFYIVDQLFAAAELRLGQYPQLVVRISRTDGEAAK